MENITSADNLKDAIQSLEKERAEKWQLLKNQSLYTVEVFKPANLFKNAVKDFVSSSHLTDNIFDTVVELANGFLTRRIISGSSVSLIRKLLGSVLQFGVTTLATQNSDSIKSFGRFLVHRIILKQGLKTRKHRS